MDYFNVCLERVLFWSRSQTTGRVTNTFTLIRETDNVTGLMHHVVNNLDALTSYSFEVGCEQRIPLFEQAYYAQANNQTCFGPPAPPANLTVNVYLNASYLISWNDPPVLFNSPPPCYYILGVRFENQASEREIEVTGTQFYLSKQETRTPLVVRITSVHDVRCLSASFPLVSDCPNKLLRSTTTPNLRITPALDFTGRASFLQQSKFFLFLSIVAALIIGF